jgi:hypothetical protein
MIKLFKVLMKALGLIKTKEEADRRLGKMWYRSETLWTNFFLVIALILHSYVPSLPQITAEDQVILLGAVNFFMRMVTNEGIRWSNKPKDGGGEKTDI